MSISQDDVARHTTAIASAYVGRHSISLSELPDLIRVIGGAIEGLGSEPAQPESKLQVPAVSIRSSIKPDHIVCLEDGKKLTMLKRYLMTHYQMTPEQYRAKWGLPKDYPMIAPNYRERRIQIAKDIGLGGRTRR